ncbi:hypothetical protein OKA04_22850 [Luteolibacter flavescens]|uniref:Uncharacterized protein n=2 Tax=Luteolibacter flavescens TaxID=1859460 RepID=A0ABT3FW98_9BACT|nr:hypothetical protein [Luteolibacter flavescens]
MMVVTLLAVGLLSLSTVELRRSNHDTAQTRARANARLALSMAIARLQETAGPDQRVTARADLKNTGDNNRWVGVWRSTRKQAGADVPAIRWDERESVLIDTRSSSGGDDGFEGWLVSGDNATPGNPGGELATLVGQGSVANVADQVKAPLVRVQGKDDAGAYAFWISDESMKASVNPVSVKATDERRFLPVRYGIGALDQLSAVDGAKDEELSKVIDHRQASLLGSTGPKAWEQHFHATGARASAVLADTLRGGLKADLSAYFEQGSVTARGDLLPAVTDATSMLGGARRKIHGPKFGSLRAFANLATKNSGSGIAPAAAAVSTRQDKFASLPRMSQFTDQPIHPVMAVAEIYTRLAYVRGYLTVHLYPRVVLWNPYNVPLASATYTVDFNLAINDSFVVEKRQQTTIDVVDTAYDTRSNKDNRMSFTLEATAFEPGEALVFSPKVAGNAIGGRAVPMALRTSGSNVLSASVDPQQLTNFYLTITQLSDKGVSASDLPLYANHNRGAYYWVDMMDWWEGNPDNGLKVSLHLGAGSNHTARMRLPLLQLVDTDNWKRSHEGRYNNGRWRVGGVEPIHDYEGTSEMEPWARGCYGFRYKWWVEKNPYNYAGRSADRFWQASVTADYNLRAAFCHRSPFDAGTDNGEDHHWYIWGPYAVDSQQGLPSLSPERASHSGKNGFRGNPFFGGANSRPDHVYPLYDIPTADERIVSLGRFQHAQLTPFVWHPTYAIGGSWVPPNQKTREKSGDTATQMTAAWSSQIQWLPAWMKQDRSRDEVVYDLSYETNHELWDRYFLSGATKVEKDQFSRDAVDSPLPNLRLYPASGTVDTARLDDFYQASSQLLLGGAFNVNSTEPGAWRALFASMRDSSFNSPGSAFPRFLNPASSEHKPSDPYDPEAWKGFRSLDDEQITALADAVVEEVKLRGPFLSVSDFINRRLVTASSADAETGMEGALQQAIERAGLNDGLHGGDLTPSSTGFGKGQYEVGSNSADWASIDHMRESKGAGMPTYLQQGDLLQSLGSFLVARGDTFVVRAYGEARTPDGQKVEARVWCEAEVQRLPDYVDPADAPEQPAFTAAGAANTAISEASQRFGRRFTVVSFRWLAPTEV